MFRWAYILAALLLASTPAFSAVKVGDPAPAITLDALYPIQPVSNATLNTLSGKAIVLEFWATWCGPCVEAIPHLNELIAQFKNKPVQFLSITDEETSLVEKFLKKRPINGWVGIARGKQTYQAFGFEGIPLTVLIDAAGKIVAITHPEALTAAHLEDLLAGRPLKLPPPAGLGDLSIARTGQESGPKALLDMIIQPSTTDQVGMRSGKTMFQVKGFTVRSLLASAYGFQQDRVIGDFIDEPARYDVSLVLPAAKDDSLRKLIPDILCSAFCVKVGRETKATDVLVLKAPHGKPNAFEETASTGMGSSSGHGEVKLVGSPVSALAGMIEGILHKIIVDETGLPGRYDLRFKYDENKPEGIVDAIRALGLVLELGRRPIEFLVVSRK